MSDLHKRISSFEIIFMSIIIGCIAGGGIGFSLSISLCFTTEAIMDSIIKIGIGTVLGANIGNIIGISIGICIIYYGWLLHVEYGNPNSIPTFKELSEIYLNDKDNFVNDIKCRGWDLGLILSELNREIESYEKKKNEHVRANSISTPATLIIAFASYIIALTDFSNDTSLLIYGIITLIVLCTIILIGCPAARACHKKAFENGCPSQLIEMRNLISHDLITNPRR